MRAANTAELEPIFSLIESNYALDFATRFAPTVLEVFPAPRITVDDASLIEGNAGDATMTFNVRLPQPSTQTVTARLRDCATLTALPSQAHCPAATSRQSLTSW